MKTLRLLTLALFLVITCTTASAQQPVGCVPGDTNSPPCCVPGDTNSPPCSLSQSGQSVFNETTTTGNNSGDIVTEIALDVLETLLSIF